MGYHFKGRDKLSFWASNLEAKKTSSFIKGDIGTLLKNNWLGGYFLPNTNQRKVAQEMLLVLNEAQTSYRQKMGDKTLCLPPQEVAYVLYKYLNERSAQESSSTFDDSENREAYGLIKDSIKCIKEDKNFDLEVYRKLILNACSERSKANLSVSGLHSIAEKWIVSAFALFEPRPTLSSNNDQDITKDGLSSGSSNNVI